MSIKTRLTLIFAGLIAAVVIPTSIVVLLFFNNSMRREIQVQLLNHADNIAALIEGPYFTEEELLNLQIDVASTVIYQVWDDDGQIISGSSYAGSEPLGTGTIRYIGPREQYREVNLKGEPYQIAYRQVASQTMEGTLLVGINYSQIAKAQIRLIINIISISILASLGAGYLCWNLIIRQFKQLRKITDFAKDDILTKNLHLRFPLPKNVTNETRDMIIAINQGLDRNEKMFESQKRFMADVSHELRTPLTVLKGNIGLMRLMRKYDDESMMTMEREIDRLSRLVGDLLMFAQADADDVQLKMERIDFDELFMEIYKQIKVLGGNQYQIDLAEIDQVTIVGDKDRLKQVMLNLGSNAIKHTPSGGIIQLGLKKGEDRLCFYVSDNGPGISEEEIPHIFDRSFKGEKARKYLSIDEKSYGIGLAIADWIVRKHRGEITVQSIEGEGSTFTVCLPYLPNGT